LIMNNSCPTAVSNCESDTQCAAMASCIEACRP
jgi:hypothetical protein